MTKKLFSMSLLMMLFFVGCNEPLLITENETMTTEMNSTIPEICPVQNDNGFLLTKEEASRALLRLFEKKTRTPYGIQLEESTIKMLKLLDEHNIKEKEILETMEDKEEAEQVLLKMHDELRERLREVRSGYYGYDLITEKNEWENEESEDFSDAPVIGSMGGWDNDDENDEFLTNHPKLIAPFLNWKDEDIEIVDGRECNLKEGLFRTILSSSAFYSAEYGRFTKDENGEWIAEIVSSEHGSRMP